MSPSPIATATNSSELPWYQQPISTFNPVTAVAKAAGLDVDPWDYFVGAVAVGGMLIGLWMIAGSPKPEVVPIPA
jgi:hypothetical protein